MIYNIIRSGVTLSGTTPIFTIVPGSQRSFQIIELDAEGMGTASAANELALYRVLAAGTGAATANTNTPQAPESPNLTGTTPAMVFSGAVNTSYATTQPTFTSSAPVHNMPLNSNGQRYYWRANANLNNAIKVPALSSNPGIVLAPISGSGVVSVRVQVDEL